MKSVASEAVARSLIVATPTATRAADRRVLSIHLTALVLLVAALVVPAVPSASAAELKWNQERVTVLARELIEPLAALRADLTSRPPVSGKEEARSAVMNDVEHLESRARELAQRLASGAGRAETVALFREVETLQSQAMKHAGEYPAPFDMHVYVDRAQSTTIQLARYYGSRDESNS
jgi:hypothetical protein